MMNDVTIVDENEPLTEDMAAPPLCLVHYFGAEAAYPPKRNPKPPGPGVVARIAERDGNLIILEFAPPPKAVLGKPRKPLLQKAADTLFLLLLLTCLIACVAAFRF